MAGGLALLGLGAMLAVPADAPTSLAEGGRSANSVERPARIPDRAAPAPRAARPQSNEQRPSRLPSAASLRIGGVHIAAGASKLGVLSNVTPPATPRPDPAASTPGPSAAIPPASGPNPPPVVNDGSAGARIIAQARMYLGVPYVFNGATPAGFDCSGYTMWVYSHAGVANLPHNSEAQRLIFRQIPQSAAQPGDLIFYMAGGTSYHVAIYAGGNLQYAAPATGQDVKIEPIWSSDIVFGTDWH